MIEVNIERQDGESFPDFHARAFTARAFAELKARDARDRRIAEILRVEGHQVRRVIDLTSDDDYDPDTGAYVAEYRFARRDQNGPYFFAAIVNGKHVGRTSFHTRALATLHALAHLDGDSVDDGYGHAAHFAARVLNIKDEAS
jgi:hypothetical protein